MSENFKINVILLKSGKSIESNEFKINLNIFQCINAQIFGYSSMSVFHTNRHYLKHQTYVYGMFFFLNFLQIFYKYFNSTVMNTYNQFCIRISPLSNHKYKPLIVCAIFFSSNVILSNAQHRSQSNHLVIIKETKLTVKSDSLMLCYLFERIFHLVSIEF